MSGKNQSREQIERLLEEWEDQKARGVTPSAAELCAEQPELIPELERRLVVSI